MGLNEEERRTKDQNPDQNLSLVSSPMSHRCPFPISNRINDLVMWKSNRYSFLVLMIIRMNLEIVFEHAKLIEFKSRFFRGNIEESNLHTKTKGKEIGEEIGEMI